MKVIFLGLIGLTLSYFVLQGRIMNRNGEKPIFLRSDKIAEQHKTKIDVKVHSMHKLEPFEVETLSQDYSNIWAHLNHLYNSNDVEAGKEYYTEDWFRQICKHYNGKIKSALKREDQSHELHVQNWSTDGLVCAAIDSNLLFKYTCPNKETVYKKASIAIVLLFQGDHWRVDAIRFIKEEPIINPKTKV